MNTFTSVHLHLTNPVLRWQFRRRQILVGSLECCMELALGLEVCTGFRSILRGNSRHRSHMHKDLEMRVTALGKRTGVRPQNPLKLEEEPKRSLRSRGLGFKHKWILKLRWRLAFPLSQSSAFLFPLLSVRPFSQGGSGNTRLMSL